LETAEKVGLEGQNPSTEAIGGRAGGGFAAISTPPGSLSGEALKLPISNNVYWQRNYKTKTLQPPCLSV